MSHVVVVLALGPAIGYDLAIPPVVFGAAVDADGAPHYDVRVCGLDDRPVPTTGGYAIVPDTGPETLAEVLATVRPNARLMSIRTGAFVLAAAGRLDGRRATTHWAYADAFRRLYPRVELDEHALFVDTDDVLTSAGLAAGLDLCLHVVRRDVGSAAANRVARYCVVSPLRAGGQAQFIDRPVPADGDDGTAPTRAWALARLHADLDLPGLAAHARMSVRTFSRRFKAETGLGSPASLRHHMRNERGVAPLAYRRAFRVG